MINYDGAFLKTFKLMPTLMRNELESNCTLCTLLSIYIIVDCIWEWEAFGPCGKTCGGGTKSRDPFIIRQGEHGGQECPPYLLDGVPQTVPDTEACNTIKCPSEGLLLLSQ